ncbi:MAG: hypothetical protein JNN00_03225 [Chitinophagaceae bacterium]|nr:hypothetical protein [Chitinophagaceae bacterium]
MKLLVIADDVQKEVLRTGGLSNDIHIEWISGTDQAVQKATFDGCIDLLFENSPERIQWLKKIQTPLVIVNAVTVTLEEIQEDFVRINGWPIFLERPVVEAACKNERIKEKAGAIISLLGKKAEWVMDITGFITPRIIACIINEAFISLEENISSKEEIDTAMKLGTNYPYGPFEWGEKTGLKNIYALLAKLAVKQKRYEPAALLLKEAMV